MLLLLFFTVIGMQLLLLCLLGGKMRESIYVHSAALSIFAFLGLVLFFVFV